MKRFLAIMLTVLIVVASVPLVTLSAATNISLTIPEGKTNVLSGKSGYFWGSSDSYTYVGTDSIKQVTNGKLADSETATCYLNQKWAKDSTAASSAKASVTIKVDGVDTKYFYALCYLVPSVTIDSFLCAYCGDNGAYTKNFDTAIEILVSTDNGDTFTSAYKYTDSTPFGSSGILQTSGNMQAQVVECNLKKTYTGVTTIILGQVKKRNNSNHYSARLSEFAVFGSAADNVLPADFHYSYRLSFDYFTYNNVINFGQAQGEASKKLDATNRIIEGKTTDSKKTITLTGWYGAFNSVNRFGYRIDGVDYFSESETYKASTEKTVTRPVYGGTYASRFSIPVDVSKLTGSHSIVGLAEVQLTSTTSTIVELKVGEVNTGFTFLHVPTAEERSSAIASIQDEYNKDALLDESILENAIQTVNDAISLQDVEDAKSAGIANVKAAQETELSSAILAALAALDEQNAIHPLLDETVLNNAKNAVSASATKDEVEQAKSEGIETISNAQKSELDDAKEAAKEILSSANAADPLLDDTVLKAGFAAIDSSATVLEVTAAKSAAILEIESAQAIELKAAQDEAAKAVRDEVKNDTNAKVLATAEAEIAKINATEKKAEVEPAKTAAIQAVKDMRALVAAQEAAEEELNVAAGNKPSDAVKAIVSDGVAAIEAAATPSKVSEELTAALNRLYAQRAAEGLEKYCMLEGTDLVDVTTASDAIYVSNAAFSKFVKVTVDSNALTAADFTVVEGSTKVTLKAAFLKTLANGTHTIVIDSGDGVAKATFAVAGQAPAPDTGDATVWFVVCAAVAVLGMGVTAVVARKKREEY